MNVTTPCFPAQWHAIAPTMANGWLLLGEVGKLMPVSNVRIDSVAVTASGITVTVKGAPGETVEFGALSPHEHGIPSYKTTTIGGAGTSIITFP